VEVTMTDDDNGLPTVAGSAEAQAEAGADASPGKATRVANEPLSEATRPVPDVPPATEPETPQSVGRSTRYGGSPAAGGDGLHDEPIPGETSPRDS
jgi:hypothetical protein